MGRFSGKGLGLFDSSCSPGPSAGTSRGWFGSSGSSAGRFSGWFGRKCGKSTSPNDSSESELITIAALPDFFLSPLPLSFTCVLWTDFALGLGALDATGIHVRAGKCADLDLVLGLPALDVDAVGLSAIRHSTICQIVSFIPSKNKFDQKLDH